MWMQDRGRRCETSCSRFSSLATDTNVEMRVVQAKMQKQACFAIRNMVVRTPELRPLVLGEGAEELIHAAMRTHPKLCGDAGKVRMQAAPGLPCEIPLWPF